ncbi:MAG TPA: LacI family DNA-binding transcriptional regulator [Chitinophagaceae bacterium]|nr:LacI family DNA-binding transcriptional regulator [Chitinophagaceae bacterium]
MALYRTTIADIARQLNTTAATVSRALNNHPGISEETKKNVLKTAEKLNYNHNRIASSLRSGKTHVIGVMIPSAEINFFGSVVHGIENIANRNGYNVLIYQSNEKWEHEVKGMETFISARVDGIIASIAKETVDYSHYTEVKKRGIPLVFFDRANDELGIPSVVIDDYLGAYFATEHLILQGYHRIAHISGQQHIKIFNDRMKGYMGALQNYHMPIDQELIYTGSVSIESGRMAIDRFLQLPNPPDAVFAVEDFTALGVIKELKERKIDIPDEFGVVGFAAEMFGEHITPSLSTIDQQTILMGSEATKLLLEIISGKEPALNNNKKIILQPLPIFRSSSQRQKVID